MAKTARTFSKLYQSKKTVCNDLSEQLQNFQADGDNIILMLDSNSNFADENFLHLVPAHHSLVDLQTNSLFPEPMPATYCHGQKKIDYILGSFIIAQAVVRGGLTSYDNGIKFFDHRPIFIYCFQEGIPFSAYSQDTRSRSYRSICSKNKQHVAQYRKYIHQHFKTY